MNFRRLTLVGFVAVLLAGSSTAVLAQTSDGGAGLGGYKLDARAQAVNVLHDSPSSPSPTHPDFDGSVPAAQSTIDTGPIGHGLASIFWPGPLGGNFGGALAQINQVCAPPLPVPGLPPVCAPVPQQLKDNSQQFNDPVRAETFFPQAPQDAKYTNIPGATMNSHIDPDGKKVQAFGQLDGFGAAGVGVVANLNAKTATTLADSSGTAEASSEVNNVVLAGGMVTIGRVFSTAKVTTDGSTAKGDAHTTVEALKIAGQSATVDEQGVHIGGQSNPLNKQVNQTIAQALAKSGLKIVMVPVDKSTSGATGSVTAGSLVIQYEDDQQQLVPGGGIQNSFTIALAGATASVDASQGSNADLGTTEEPVSPETPGVEGTSIAGPDVTPAGLGEFAPPAAATFRAPRGRVAALPTQLTLNSFGLAWGLVLLALLLALGLAFGLRRVTDEVFADAPAVAACPLEEPPR